MTRCALGLASTCYLTARRFTNALEFLDHAHQLGAAGIQIGLRPEQAREIRQRCEQRGMYFEAMSPMPRADAAPFETTLRAASEAGAMCVRVACLGGRRYETFKSLNDWEQFVATSKASIRVALSLAEKARLPVALENHKDWTLDELHSLLREFQSEWLGVCLDTGNNIALLDDPHEFVETLAPYAISTHIKDMALQEYADGFLLSEVPLGAGQLDMPRIIAAIRKARPSTKLTLEMITRNPLEIPCLKQQYWATFPHRHAPSLARTLALARASKRPLPRLDTLPPQARANWEEDNVKSCLNWARRHLG